MWIWASGDGIFSIEHLSHSICGDLSATSFEELFEAWDTFVIGYLIGCGEILKIWGVYFAGPYSLCYGMW